MVVVPGALAAGLVVVQPLCGIPAAFAESLPAPIVPVRLQNPCISTPGRRFMLWHRLQHALLTGRSDRPTQCDVDAAASCCPPRTCKEYAGQAPWCNADRRHGGWVVLRRRGPDTACLFLRTQPLRTCRRAPRGRAPSNPAVPNVPLVLPCAQSAEGPKWSLSTLRCFWCVQEGATGTRTVKPALPDAPPVELPPLPTEFPPLPDIKQPLIVEARTR